VFATSPSASGDDIQVTPTDLDEEEQNDEDDEPRRPSRKRRVVELDDADDGDNDMRDLAPDTKGKGKRRMTEEREDSMTMAKKEYLSQMFPSLSAAAIRDSITTADRDILKDIMRVSAAKR